MICKNCHNEFEGAFCNHCGQNANVKRLNAHYLFNEFPSSIFQVDKGFFFTVHQLFIRPADAIKDFINGKRKPYFKPLAFLLLTSSIYILLNYLLDKNTFFESFIEGYLESYREAHDLTEKEVSNIQSVNWIIKNQTYVILFFIPIISIASYVVYYRFRLNYVEHLVLNIYVIGQQMIIFSLLSMLIKNDSPWALFPIVLTFLYNVWVYFSFFRVKNFILRIINVLLLYVMIIFIIFLFSYVYAIIFLFLRG